MTITDEQMGETKAWGIRLERYASLKGCSQASCWLQAAESDCFDISAWLDLAVAFNMNAEQQAAMDAPVPQFTAVEVLG